MHSLLFFIFLGSSTLEGLGLWADRRMFLLFFSTISTACYVLIFSTDSPIKVPLKAGIAYIGFLVFAGTSTFLFSIDKQVSFELLFFYFACFLYFIFFYNYKERFSRYMTYVPIIIGCFYTLYSLSIPLIKKQGWNLLLPTHEKQFVFASYLNHNHLGDYVGLAVVFFAYYLFQKKWIAVFPLFISFFVLILSFSRSAYTALFGTLLFIVLSTRKKFSILTASLLGGFLILIMLSFYLISTKQPINSPFFGAQSFIKKTFKVSPRNTIPARDIFIQQSIISIKNHPLFGIGGGNFSFASKHNIIEGNLSDSAHTIFLELATEQGLISTFFFLFFLILIIGNVISNPSLPGYFFIYLLINFQSDYTYQIYGLFLIWVIFIGLSYAEKREIHLPNALFGVLCIAPLFCFACINTSALLVKMDNIEGAIRWYPYNKNAYLSAIKKSHIKSPIYIKAAEQIAPHDLGVAYEAANYYFKQGDAKKALSYYYSIFEDNNLCSFEIVKKIYLLKIKLNSQQAAYDFLNAVAHAYKNVYITSDFKREFIELCRIGKAEKCPQFGTYIPGGEFY